MNGMMVLGMKKNKQWRVNIRYFRQRYGVIIALIIAILISIFLSVQLWYSPDQSTKQQRANETAQENATGENLTSVYGISQLVFNQSDKKISAIDYRTLYAKIVDRVKKWDAGYKSIEVLKKQDYLDALSQEKSIVMTFPDAVSGHVIKSIFGTHIKLANHATINHVQVPQGDSNKFYFYDDRHRKRYTYQISNAPKKLRQLKPGKKTADVSYQWVGKHVMAATTTSVNLQSYSYLLDVDSTVSRLTKLFSDGGTRDVNNGQEILTYSNGDNRRMQHNVTTGLINYDAYNINRNVNSLSQRQSEGYLWLLRLHQTADNLYYFEEHDRGQTLTYRLFVNGLPIFGQTTYGGTVRVKQLPNNHERIGMSQYSLRVPLPTDQKNQVNLEPMNDAMAKLKSVGVARDDIEQMTIGYRWQLDTDNQIVTLHPEWCFEQDHVWRSVNEQVKSEQGGH